MASKTIITHLNQKTGVDSLGRDMYVELPIGPEVRYIGSQRNSNNNNLEEQLILGTDYKVNSSTTTVENNKIKTEKTIIYQTNDSPSDNNYYQLEITEIKDFSTSVDEASKTLTLNLNPGTVITEKLKYHTSDDNLVNINQKVTNSQGASITPIPAGSGG